MAKQEINIGTSANDGTGDPLRTAFTKVNENFTELYTETAPISKFVAVNVNGVISGSDDGVTWTDYQSNLNSISRVAVGPNNIVYIADSGDSLWYADAYDTEPTQITTAEGSSFSQVKYFKSISKFIAVGQDASSNPGLYYSNNGVDWTTSGIDSTYLETFTEYAGNSSFVDISENQLGFFILSDSSYLGGFFLSNITNTINGDNHVDLSSFGFATPEQVVYTDSYFFNGWHIITNTEGTTGWYYNGSTNPTTDTFTSNFIDIDSIMSQEIGIGSSLAEVIVGSYANMSTVMISTQNGQIVYWPAVPDGPFVSVPKPYTSTITGWTSSSESVITWTNVTGSGNNGTGEKFTVTGSSVTDYNGTFYIGNAGEVFTDSAMNTPFDTTGFSAFTGTATIAWSNGQYIDALHYNNDAFYAGNDDEELFKSVTGGETWTQVDQLDGTGGETYLNDIDSYISDTGLITFNGVQIRGVSSEGKSGLIKLVPQTAIDSHSFLDNGQFIQVYPTISYDAPHIHIAAGVGGASEGDLFLGDDDKFVQVNHNGTVSVQSYNYEDSYFNNWAFNTDATVTFPTVITNLHNGGNQSAQTLKFGDTSQQVVITGPTPTGNDSAQRLIVQGQRGAGTGEGGDVYFWAGDADNYGGDIKIYAGDADSGSTGYGGYVNVQGGQGFNEGGQVNIQAGGSPGGSGAHVYVTAGNGAVSNGSVYLRTYGHDWQFKPDGSVLFPSGGKIESAGMGWMGITNGTTGDPVSIEAKNPAGAVRSNITVSNSNTYGQASITTIKNLGIPNTGNYTAASSTGSWDANPVTALDTTGGSGSGLTVDVVQSGSGYADYVTVVSAGSGYINGETITVTSNDSSATFIITVDETSNSWYFSETGKTTLPGAIAGRVQANEYTDTTINLDVNATINKITPINNTDRDHYHLSDGVEGQIMYITLAGTSSTTESVMMHFDSARYTNGSGNITVGQNVSGWMPFRSGSNTTPTTITLLFIDGYWNLPHSNFI